MAVSEDALEDVLEGVSEDMDCSPPLYIGGWQNSRDSWLHLVLIHFNLPSLRPVRQLCFQIMPMAYLIVV